VGSWAFPQTRADGLDTPARREVHHDDVFIPVEPGDGAGSGSDLDGGSGGRYGPLGAKLFGHCESGQLTAETGRSVPDHGD
jgi:hypothetical protein